MSGHYSERGWTPGTPPSTARPGPVDELRERLDSAIPHTMGCVAHRSAGPSGCICFHNKTLDRLLPVVEQERATLEQRARDLADAIEAGAFGIPPARSVIVARLRELGGGPS